MSMFSYIQIDLLVKQLDGLNLKFSDKEKSKLTKLSDNSGRLSK